MLHFFNRAAKTHEKFLHRAEPKDGLCFRNWLWLRGAALTCSCSSWHRIHALCLAYSLFTPHSSVAIEASPTVASFPSPKALGMLPVDAIFIRRRRNAPQVSFTRTVSLQEKFPSTGVICYLRYLHVSKRNFVSVFLIQV